MKKAAAKLSQAKADGKKTKPPTPRLKPRKSLLPRLTEAPPGPERSPANSLPPEAAAKSVEKVEDQPAICVSMDLPKVASPGIPVPAKPPGAEASTAGKSLFRRLSQLRECFLRWLLIPRARPFRQGCPDPRLLLLQVCAFTGKGAYSLFQEAGSCRCSPTETIRQHISSSSVNQAPASSAETGSQTWSRLRQAGRPSRAGFLSFCLEAAGRADARTQGRGCQAQDGLPAISPGGQTRQGAETEHQTPVISTTAAFQPASNLKEHHLNRRSH